MVANLRNVDDELAKRVANGLGIELPKRSAAARKPIDMDPSPALSIHTNMKNTLVGRAIGVLIADGSDASTLKKLKNAIERVHAKMVLVAPKIGNVVLSDGKAIKADGQLLGSPSQIFDAVVLLLSAKSTTLLLREGAAIQWVMDAFGHLKAIGYSAESKPILDRAGIEPDEGVMILEEGFVKAAARRYWEREPKVRMLA